MPLNSEELATKQAWPLAFTKGHHPFVPNPAGRSVALIASALVKATFTDPIAPDDNGLSTSHAGAAVAGTRDMVLDGDLAADPLDLPRNVVIVVTHGSSVVAMSGTIYGLDEYGNQITEAWSVTATGTSKTYTGTRAFKRVTRITETVAADASTNSIIAGTGKGFGLPFKSALPSIVKELSAGSVLTNGAIAAGNDSRGVYTPNGTPNGSTSWTIWYIVDDIDLT